MCLVLFVDVKHYFMFTDQIFVLFVNGLSIYYLFLICLLVVIIFRTLYILDAPLLYVLQIFSPVTWILILFDVFLHTETLILI